MASLPKLLFVLLNAIYLSNIVISQDYIHPPISYHTQGSGTYNFGYDTGLASSHVFHHEHKESNNHLSYSNPKEVIGNHINNNLNDRTNNKPLNPRIPTITVTPTPLRKPYLIRKYRHSENSRLYLAGRDYGETPSNREPIPIHRVESPRPSFGGIGSIRSVTPSTVRTSVPLINSYERSVLPSLPSHITDAQPSRVATPLVYSGSSVSSPSHITNAQPYRFATPSIYSGRGIASAPIPSHTANPQPSRVAAPVTYSGRGIPSPSAAIRLRAQALRSSAT